MNVDAYQHPLNYLKSCVSISSSLVACYNDAVECY